MGAIFSAGFRWLAWNAATLAVILTLLVGGAWLKDELKLSEDLRRDRASLAAEVDELTRQISDKRRNVNERSRRALSAMRNSESILEKKRAERDALRAKHWFARYIPMSEAWQRLELLEKDISVHQVIVTNEARAKEKLEQGLNTLVAQREQESRRLDVLDVEIDKTFLGRTAVVIERQLPLALTILIGILLAPIGIKLLLYYAIAPLAASRPPIHLLPEAAGSVRECTDGPTQTLGVSVPVLLKEHEELLIQPDYLQSTALRAEKSTRWLLNAAIPFSSLLSGMFMLTRVGPAGQEPVIVSATGDSHSEVGIIELAEGAAFVCQPRCLAGVIQDSRRPVRISRHWRLGTLQSWLTLQLRFLVFHGPGKLILKGGRGIRVEAPGAGRLINQAATLGFSANLAYATTRCETFISYLRGKEELFNELFTGENGVYVYEEVPDPGRTGGGAGPGLQGFADTILKLFGV